MAAGLATWFLLLVLGAVMGAPEEEDGVLVLTNDNFDESLTSLDVVLIEFYAPWCGHCKSLEPEYAKAASMLKDEGLEIKLAKVDVTKERVVSEKYDIQGFPTLKLFKKGSEDPIDYSGSRTADGIVGWLKKKTGPPVQEVTDVALLVKMAEKSVIIAGFFNDLTGANAKLFESIADKDEKNKYVYIKLTNDPIELEDSSILLYKNFDEKIAKFAGEKFDAESINLFVSKNSRPDIFEFNEQNSEQVFGSGIHQHLIILSSIADSNYPEILKMGSEVGKKFKEDIITMHLDTDREDHKGIMDFLGVKDSDLPTFMIFLMSTSTKYYPENKEISVENLEKFAKDLLDDKLKPTLKSADLPADWDSAPVKVLVSSNFNEIALDKTKDVFVKFYAPWCGHCKSLAPIWDQLGEKFKDRTDVVIAKVDSTENEIEGQDVQGFPTLKLFKKETNEIIDYDGRRDLDSLIRLVETGNPDEDSTKGNDDDDDDDSAEDDDDDDEDDDDEVKPKDEL